MACATTGGMMVPVSEVKVGDRLYAPDTFPNGLWGEVTGAYPTSSPAGYIDFHMIEDTTSGRAADNRQTVTLKVNGSARVRRPPANFNPPPAAGPLGA